MSGASGLRPHDHASAGSGGTIAGLGTQATIVATLTNKSGGGVIAGDVVILDGGNNDAFTTTTSAASVAKVGIAAATIANNAAGLVVVGGYVGLVNVTASATRGDFLFTSTTVKKASAASFGTGAFGVVTKAGTTPTAVIFLDTQQAGSSIPEITGTGLGNIDFDAAGLDLRTPNAATNGGPGAYVFMEDTGPKIEFFADHTPGAFADLGMQFRPGSDANGVIISERSSTVMEIHTDSAPGYNVVLMDAPSSGTLAAGRFAVEDENGDTSYPSKGMVRQFSSAPTGTFEGEHYYDTTTHKEYAWDGSTWVDLASSGGASFATPSLVLGSSAAAGAASTVIRSDATIAAFDATSPTTQAIGDSAVVGTAAFAARRDHKHAVTNPLTTQDDLWVGGASGAPSRLAKGTDSQVLTVDPVTHHLAWATNPAGFADPMTSRGDIIVRDSGNATARLAKGSADTYLGSNGTDVSYSAVTDAKLSTSDVTTNNVSTSKHGFAPKGDGNAAHYLDGTGAYSTPAGGGGGSTVVPTLVQTKFAGTAASSVTLDAAPASGHAVILILDGTSTGQATAVSSTNTTWTQIVTTNAASCYYAIWVGVVSGVGGTVITVTHPNSFMSMLALEITDTLTGTAGATTVGTNTTRRELAATTAGHLVVLASGTDNTTLRNTLYPSIPVVGIPFGIVECVLGYSQGQKVYLDSWVNAGSMVMAEIT
jgi:hypothetical protein